MVQRGDVVLITVGGKQVNALVHAFNPFHEGGPSIHVSVVADDPIDNNTRKPKVMPIGYIPESVMLHDVTEWKEISTEVLEGLTSALKLSNTRVEELEKRLDQLQIVPQSGSFDPAVELDGSRADVTVDLQKAADSEGAANA